MPISQLVDGEWVSLTDEEHAAQILAEAAADGIDLCPRCFFVNRVNGVCEMCARDAVFNADPGYRMWSDAQARLDFGDWAPDSTRPYMLDDADVDKATVARLEAKFALAEQDAKTEPGGCAVCGVPEREHMQRWHPHGHSKSYIPPTDRRRLARRYARRAKRLGLPVWSRPGRGAA